MGFICRHHVVGPTECLAAARYLTDYWGNEGWLASGTPLDGTLGLAEGEAGEMVVDDCLGSPQLVGVGRVQPDRQRGAVGFQNRMAEREMAFAMPIAMGHLDLVGEVLAQLGQVLGAMFGFERARRLNHGFVPCPSLISTGVPRTRPVATWFRTLRLRSGGTTGPAPAAV
ncbi:protein of unknown function [Aminobacter niigataensis]|nr:protein of unknown function [Aminobacter niigataensis]